MVWTDTLTFYLSLVWLDLVVTRFRSFQSVSPKNLSSSGCLKVWLLFQSVSLLGYLTPMYCFHDCADAQLQLRTLRRHCDNPELEMCCKCISIAFRSLCVCAFHCELNFWSTAMSDDRAVAGIDICNILSPFSTLLVCRWCSDYVCLTSATHCLLGVRFRSGFRSANEKPRRRRAFWALFNLGHFCLAVSSTAKYDVCENLTLWLGLLA